MRRFVRDIQIQKMDWVPVQEKKDVCSSPYPGIGWAATQTVPPRRVRPSVRRPSVSPASCRQWAAYQNAVCHHNAAPDSSVAASFQTKELET